MQVHIDHVRLTQSGNLMRRRCLELGLTIQEFADKIEMSAQRANDLMTQGYHFTPETIARIATALDLPQEKLLQTEALKGRPKDLTKREPTSLGQLVFKKRREQRLTQEMLARLAGTSSRTISKLEREQYCTGGDLLNKIFHVLECEFPVELIPPPKRRGRPKKQLPNV